VAKQSVPSAVADGCEARRPLAASNRNDTRISCDVSSVLYALASHPSATADGTDCFAT